MGVVLVTDVDSPDRQSTVEESHSHPIRRLFDSEFRMVIRNSSWSLAGTGVTVGALFVETTVLARYFGPHRFGVYLLVIAYPEAIQLLLDFRTREALTRYLGTALARGESAEAVAITKLLWMIDLAVVCLAYALVFATAPLVAQHLTGSASSSQLMRIYGLALLAGGLDATAGSVLRVFNRFGLSFFVGATSMLIRLAMVVTAVSLGTGLHGIVWIRVFAEIGATTLALTAAVVLLKHAVWSDWRAGFEHLSGRRREIIGFLVHMNLQGSLRAAAGKLDVIAVGAIAGPSSASLYKIGIQYGSTPLLFSDPLFVSVYPQFARMHAVGRTAEIRRIGRRSSVVLSVVSIPATLALAVLSKQVLGAIVGHAFVSAWLPFTVALCGVAPAAIFFWGRAAMLTLGDAQVATAIAAASVAIQFLVLLSLTPVLKATGAAIGFAALSVASVFLTIRYLRARGLL